MNVLAKLANQGSIEEIERKLDELTETEKRILSVSLKARRAIHERKARERRALDPKHQEG